MVESDQTRRTSLAQVQRPPFDGSEPCIWCPVEVRGLHATAHNAVGAFFAAVSGSGSWERCGRKMAELKSAVERTQAHSDAHFADRAHSHGEVKDERGRYVPIGGAWLPAQDGDHEDR